MLSYSKFRNLLAEGKILKSVRENYVNYDLVVMYDGMPILTNVQRSLTYNPSSVNWTSEETIKLIYKRTLEIKANMEVVIEDDEISFIMKLIRKVTSKTHNQPHTRNYAFFAMENEFPSVHDFDLSTLPDSLLN